MKSQSEFLRRVWKSKGRPELSRRELWGGFWIILAQNAVPRGGHPTKKGSAPGSEAARDKWLLKKKVDFLEEVLSQAAKLPRTSGFFKKKSYFAKRPAPGNEAAQDK